ncbi:MAG: aminotransferase class I/II-fold pyridoxal phosphate-dependent enzyme [Planctomycetes bacterium]|nr:aminotransferase class I/II-fold pyridoxal phosphate-dependent enzyme [Planctomycetota bacterium]
MSNSEETWLPDFESNEDDTTLEMEGTTPHVPDAIDDFSLADVMRARDQGMGIRQAARQFQEAVTQLESRGMNLYRRTLLDPSDAQTRVYYSHDSHNREMIMLASNNYLGLTNHPRVVRAAQQAAEQYGTGSGSAPLLVGTFPITRRLESQLAELKHSEEACVFASGYQTNVGVISSLVRKDDLVVIDQLGHASMWDGANMSDAKVRAFKHNDPEHLDRVLTRNHQAGTKLVCVEGLYSMDGDLPRLREICKVARRHGALLLLDEAHSTGVLGANGGGAAEHFGVEDQIDLHVGTLSKSLASCGGFVTGDSDLVNYIRYFARSAMFSAAPSPMVMAAASAAIEVMHSEPARRTRLWENSHFVHSELKRLGFETSDEVSPIIPIIVGSMRGLRQMTLELHENNVCVNSVPYPVVPHGGERLRISLTANHTREQLVQAVEAIRIAGVHAGLISASAR